MRVEILTIGDEVLDGQIVNTNAAFLGKALSEQGYTVGAHRALPDCAAAIRLGLKEALAASDFVVVTGGLGPTIDDLTKGVAADVLGRPIRFDEALYAELRKRYPDSEALKNQALVPAGALVVPNRVGSASGLLLGSLLLLPGPPREMEPMFVEEALPLLRRKFPLAHPPKTVHLSLCVTNELDLDPILHEIQREHPDAEIGIYPSYGTLRVRFRISHRFERLAIWTERIRQAFPTHLFSEPSIAAAVHRRLIEKGKTLALAESCTGGEIAARLVAMADASKYLLGSMVVYSNEWKRRFLGVSKEMLEKHGAVSCEVVVEMAQGLLAKTDADYAIAVSGIAGPTGGSLEKPVGTLYIAVAERSGALDAGKARLQLASRSSVIEYAVQTSLSALYRRIAYNTMSFS